MTTQTLLYIAQTRLGTCYDNPTERAFLIGVIDALKRLLIQEKSYRNTPSDPGFRDD